MLAACRGAAEAAGIDYPRLVYPYLETEMNLATPIPLERLCQLPSGENEGWRATPGSVVSGTARSRARRAAPPRAYWRRASDSGGPPCPSTPSRYRANSVAGVSWARSRRPGDHGEAVGAVPCER